MNIWNFKCACKHRIHRNSLKASEIVHTQESKVWFNRFMKSWRHVTSHLCSLCWFSPATSPNLAIFPFFYMWMEKEKEDCISIGLCIWLCSSFPLSLSKFGLIFFSCAQSVMISWWSTGHQDFLLCMQRIAKSLIHLNFYCNTLSQCIPWAEAQDRTKSNSLENVNLLTGLYNITPLETGSKEMSYFAHNLNLSILDYTSDKQGIKYILGTRARFNLLQA